MKFNNVLSESYKENSNLNEAKLSDIIKYYLKKPADDRQYGDQANSNNLQYWDGGVTDDNNIQLSNLETLNILNKNKSLNQKQRNDIMEIIRAESKKKDIKANGNISKIDNKTKVTSNKEMILNQVRAKPSLLPGYKLRYPNIDWSEFS